MIRVNDNNQVQLFTTPFGQELDLENRWVKFSNLLPWNKLSSFYYTRMSSGMDAGTNDARIVLGAIIIKHHEILSDEGAIDAIKENIYMQYFLGLPSFKKQQYLHQACL
jgi:IS5 family transposase